MRERIHSGIFRRIRNGLFNLGYSLVEQTEPEQVQNLITRLRPVDCGIDLIRIGGTTDGGYLVPNDLEGIEYCFSPGVNTISDFESHLADLKIKSFMADYSVAALPVERPEFTFDKKYLGASDRGPYITLQSWKDKYLKDYSGDLILQMDIEACEYEVLLSAPDSLLDQFRIMAIEFHGMDRLFDPFSFKIIESCFEKLLKRFHVLHIHPNNCGAVLTRGKISIPESLEFTFLNRKRADVKGFRADFPHRTDTDNCPRWPSLVLPKCWYLPE